MARDGLKGGAIVSRGPMAKHPSARRRTNAPASTAREIVLRGADEPLLPVPPLPTRNIPQRNEQGNLVKGPDGNTLTIAADWHEQAVIAWAQMWQFPLWYQAPEVDRHFQVLYIATLDQTWRNMESGKPFTELLNQLRMMSEQWGIGEKARRGLQITIQMAEEAMSRGFKHQPTQVPSQTPSTTAYTPEWGDDDEDSATVDAEVVS